MGLLVAADQVDKVFSLADGSEYIALKGIDLTIKQGEFISFIGHSGCGKSTLLNMIAGLSLPSSGVITLEGKQIKEPGPDRMVVFQNYSLLPWRSVRDNIGLAVNTVYGDLPRGNGVPSSRSTLTWWDCRRRRTKCPTSYRGDETTGGDRPGPGDSAQVTAAGRALWGPRCPHPGESANPINAHLR
jgi:bicarbonate transport system ATP-binding protein